MKKILVVTNGMYNVSKSFLKPMLSYCGFLDSEWKQYIYDDSIEEELKNNPRDADSILSKNDISKLLIIAFDSCTKDDDAYLLASSQYKHSLKIDKSISVLNLTDISTLLKLTQNKKIKAIIHGGIYGLTTILGDTDEATITRMIIKAIDKTIAIAECPIMNEMVVDKLLHASYLVFLFGDNSFLRRYVTDDRLTEYGVKYFAICPVEEN